MFILKFANYVGNFKFNKNDFFWINWANKIKMNLS